MKVTVAALTLVTVADFGELVLPTAIVPKFNDVGDTVIDWPTPVKATVCGLPGALSVNDKRPVRVPFLVGVKVTLTAQFAPAGTVDPHVLVEMW